MALDREEPVFEPPDVPDSPAQAWAQLASLRASREALSQQLAAVTRERDWLRQELLYMREEVVDSDMHREKRHPQDDWWERWHRENLVRLDKVLEATKDGRDA